MKLSAFWKILVSQNMEDRGQAGRYSITIDEYENILGSFQTRKTPGNYGIPIEFYKTFWPIIGVFMTFDSISEAYDYNALSSSQQQAIISLIDKNGQDRNYLENWRPISLTSVGTKIVSKVIAARIIPVLPQTINSTQTGYVKSRFIGEAAS